MTIQIPPTKQPTDSNPTRMRNNSIVICSISHSFRGATM